MKTTERPGRELRTSLPVSLLVWGVVLTAFVWQSCLAWQHLHPRPLVLIAAPK